MHAKCRWGATYHGSVTQTPSPVRADGTGDGTAPLPAARGRVLLAAPRGYCAGVDRAVIAVEKALELYGAPVYVRKQIVHNKHVVRRSRRAARSSSTRPTRCPRAPPSCSRAHGVAPAVHEEAAARGLQDDRRDLPAGDEGAPARPCASPPTTTTSCSSATRATRRSRAPPARRPSTSRSSTGPTTSTTSRCATRRRWSGCRRPRSPSTRPWRRCGGCASGSRSCRTRRATTSATRRRTARWR